MLFIYGMQSWIFSIITTKNHSHEKNENVYIFFFQIHTLVLLSTKTTEVMVEKYIMSQKNVKQILCNELLINQRILKFFYHRAEI